MPRRLRRVAAVGLALAALAAPPARAQDRAPEAPGDELATVARELVKRRAEVDALATAIARKKAEIADRLRELRRKRAEAERRAEQLRRQAAELDKAIERETEELEGKRARRARVKPAVARQADAIAARIAAGLPFKRAERQAEIAAIKRKLDKGEIEPEQALARLWTAVEDELRLTREIGLYRQRIELDGAAELVDVVKLGAVLLYFKTLDGRVGMAVPASEAWIFRATNDPADQRQIEALFAALEKGIRQGFFPLPNPYQRGAEKP